MGGFDKTTFLACHDCQVLQPVAAEVLWSHDEAGALAREALEEFAACHRSHRTGHLRRCGSECHADRPLWDPMVTLTFAATDGERSYLVIAGRSSIDAPRVYRFQPGGLSVQCSEVAVDTADLRHGLDLQFHPYALRPTKLDRFLSAVHDIVSHIDPEDLEIAFDVADDPAASVARMPDEVYWLLVARCAEIFDPWELQRVTTFLQDNRDADGLLAIRVRRHLTVLNG
jgi:hypothetical protein